MVDDNKIHINIKINKKIFNIGTFGWICILLWVIFFVIWLTTSIQCQVFYIDAQKHDPFLNPELSHEGIFLLRASSEIIFEFLSIPSLVFMLYKIFSKFLNNKT